MSDQFCITLTPNSFDSRPKTFTIGQRLWLRAVRMVDRAGVRLNIVGGLDKRDIPLFATSLEKALAKERVSEHDRHELERLVKYLKSDGDNVRGLALSRGFHRLNRR